MEDTNQKKIIELHKDILRAFDVISAMKNTKSKPFIEELLTEYAVKNGPKEVIADYKKALQKAATEETMKKK
ncbi:MAG TPA: hypothetical protein VF691_14185 [Cytophagaceae bacterium]|jgi:hypothetical protein